MTSSGQLSDIVEFYKEHVDNRYLLRKAESVPNRDNESPEHVSDISSFWGTPKGPEFKALSIDVPEHVCYILIPVKHVLKRRHIYERATKAGG